jgi:glycosyltransferase involved in cell wall biosynthesis
MDRLPVRRWGYYCTDDLSVWPGLDGTTIRAMEERLIERADVLIAVSSVLRDQIGRLRQPVHLLTHGVELRHWNRGQPPTSDEDSPGFRRETSPTDQTDRDDLPLRIDSLEGLERPLIVFWGVIDRRMDVAFLERLAHDLTCGTILLVGPESDPDPALDGLPRVVRHAAMPFERLPHLAGAARVLIMPYADLPATRAMEPLKLKEYLATGRPVVVRDLPANRTWADAVDLVGTPETFSQAVRERLTTGVPEPQRRARGRLVDESWQGKARDLERWMLAEDEVTRAMATVT